MFSYLRENTIIMNTIYYYLIVALMAASIAGISLSDDADRSVINDEDAIGNQMRPRTGG